ncbi:LysR substrate-binding domain-containing protein [Dellaglioa sp. BT-FLS60]
MEVAAIFKNLEIFKSVYETRNFTISAQLLFLSQPTISVQIKQLEARLGVTLFERNGRQQIIPTESGKLLYQQTQQLLDLWQQDLFALQHQKSDQKIACKVAASHTTAAYLLPKLLRQNKEAMKQLELEISVLNSSQIMENLKQHKLDFGFIEKPLTEKNINRQSLTTDQLVWAGDTTEPWLLREQGSGVYHYSINYLKANNLTLEHFMTVKSNSLIIQLLRQGIGQSIISSAALADYPEIPVKTLAKQYQREFYLVSRNELPKPIEAFVAQLANAFTE